MAIENKVCELCKRSFIVPAEIYTKPTMCPYCLQFTPVRRTGVAIEDWRTAPPSVRPSAPPFPPETWDGEWPFDPLDERDPAERADLCTAMAIACFACSAIILTPAILTLGYLGIFFTFGFFPAAFGVALAYCGGRGTTRDWALFLNMIALAVASIGFVLAACGVFWHLNGR